MIKSYETSLKKTKINQLEVEYIVLKRNVKYPRLEIRPEALYIILPRNYQSEKQVLENKADWITKKYTEIKKIIDSNKKLLEKFPVFNDLFDVKTNNTKNFNIDYDKKIINLNLTQHKKEFIDYLKKKLREKIIQKINEYNPNETEKINKVTIRMQKTKWASCSDKGNLSFNLKIVSLPENLVDYIIHHELLHLDYKKHDYNFKQKLSEKFPNYKQLERALYKYWFLINKNKTWRKLI